MRHDHHQTPGSPVIRAELQASLLAPRQARAAVRQALSTWGLAALADDAELLAGELVANAAEHADGTPIGLTICQHAEPGGRRGILCQITDSASALPEHSHVSPTANVAAACRSSPRSLPTTAS